MAYSSTTKSAAEQAAQAADKVLFLARNVLKHCFVLADWKNASGFARNLTGYEADYAADGLADIPTKPEVASPAEVVCDLLFNIDASINGAANVVDGIVITGHNFHTLARAYATTLTVTAEIADDDVFTGPDVTQLAQWSITAGYRNPRLVSFDLAGAAGRYTSVEWFRLRISSPVAFSLNVPEVGEVFLGRTRQLGRAPDRPFDYRAARSTVSTHRTKTGQPSTYELFAHETPLSMVLSAYDGTDDATGLDDVATLRALYEDTYGGVEPFIVVPQPETYPTRAHLARLEPPEQLAVFADLDVGEYALNFIEYPPFVGPEGYTT